MPFSQQFARPFAREAIERLTPNQYGVYGILNANGWIYIGRGNIRERLLAHLTGTDGIPGIRLNGPTRFVTEITGDDVARERELIVELDPVCNRTASGS